MNILERLLLIVPLVLIPCFGAQLTNAVLLYKERHQEVRRLAQASADVYNTELDQVVVGLQRLLGAVAELPSVHSLRPSECDAALRQLAEEFPHDVMLAAADLSGKIICASVPHDIELSIGDRSFFIEARDSFVIGGYLKARLGGSRAIPFAAPIRSNDGRPIGVMVAYLSLDWLSKTLERPRLGPGQSLIVTDRDGIVLADLGGGSSRVGLKLPPDQLSMAHADGPGVVELKDRQDRATIFGYVPITVPPPNIYLLFGIDHDVAFAPIYTAAWRSLALGVISLLSALAIAWIVGVSFVRRPIEHLIDAAHAWRDGDYFKRAELREGPKEIRYLGAAFDDMADALRVRDEQLAKAVQFKNMILAAAGHDLRQPLQIIVFAVHAFSRRSLDLSDRRLIQRAEQAIQRLTNELDMLINVARMGDKNLRLHPESFAVGSVLKEVADRWSHKAREKRLRLLVRSTDSSVVSDRTLLVTILDNLVANAIKYTDRGGVLLGCRRRSGQLWIEIYDTGTGIPKDKIPSIFEEFEQLDSAKGGFGLGLWIARTAADALGQDLSVSSTVGRGSRFRIVVPINQSSDTKTVGYHAA